MAKEARAASKSSPVWSTKASLNQPQAMSTSVNDIPATSAYSPRQIGLDSIQLDPCLRPATAGEAIISRYAKTNLWNTYALDSPTMDITTEKDTFHFPTPSRRPITANNSPRLGPTKMSSIDSGIGMSMTSLNSRSPFMSPLSSQYAVTPAAEEPESMPPPIRANTTREFRNVPMEGSRPKLSRWRSLGGIFGRKKSETSPSSASSSTNLLSNQETDATSAAIRIDRSQSRSKAQHSPNMFRRVTKRGARVRGASLKDQTQEQSQEQTSLVAPHLDIHIPEAEMERYSVLFNQVAVLPNRSDSLLVRRQGVEDNVWPKAGSKLRPIDVTITRPTRRATEPLSQVTNDVMQSRSPEAKTSHVDGLPHISSLLSRPTPIQRYNTAPTLLAIPATKDQQLSPTSEANEIDLNDQGNTPSPSSPASPSTPKDVTSAPVWKAPNTSSSRMRNNSWENDSTAHLNNPTWEIITVSKRLSSGDIPPTEAAHSKSSGNNYKISEEWTEGVSVARSLSVTKAGNRSQLKPTRVNSRRNGATSLRKKQTQQQASSQSGNDPPPVPQKDSVRGERKDSATQASSPAAAIAPQPAIAVTRMASRKQELQRDLTLEIWGEHGLSAVPRQVRENRALLPNLRVVEEAEIRKSVYAVMESV